ncbi:MAG: CooT family nickel-binding protein [Oscillospiraceae bacterium]|jgi:predicted RNA-binding protein|nr:CooT family nickel-binding protein [Oscillospiraceae bacterium]
MCLSTAYRNEKTDSSVLATNITNIRIDGDRVFLTDLMDETIEVEGALQFADLIGGYVIISSK